MIAVMAYAVFGRFCGAYSFFLFLPCLLVALLYLVNVLVNIVFAVARRKKYDRSSIPLRLNIVALLFLYILPTANHNKAYPRGCYSLQGSTNYSNVGGLYREYYKVFGGGFMTTDEIAIYITDHRNFRLYLGTYDESNKSINVVCNGDQITATKETSDKIERKVYSLKLLKESHYFE